MMNEIATNSTARKGRWTLIALFAVAALPIAAAYIMFFTGMGVPDHTVNKGTMLPQAVKLEHLLAGENNAFLEKIAAEKKWRILIPITGDCGKACVQNLYTTRQVHIRLSEKSVRLQRVAVNIGAAKGEEQFQQLKLEHPLLEKITVDEVRWREWLAASGATLDETATPYYLLMDQEGFAMMVYTAEQHGNELLKDIKRALKYSIDYQ
ncbi:hypothetical protein [Teredinibacter haidensis]|uniref:hypothetical protein n=1 Tax=Teredinibacter haidensis TaxID=2731755 RepID=UPI0009490D0F|nr:hypothetical protein [Teredinibacter haidensis]